MLRRGSWILVVVCLGCHSLPVPEAEPEAERPSAAALLWEQGQAAMRAGQPQEAVRCYEQSLAADPALTRNYLSLGAAYLECGKIDAACEQLAKHLETDPDHVVGRAHYAELLFKLKRLDEARVQFERYVAQAQDSNEKPRQIIHAFGRLMDIAALQDNEYDEHLYRGIGLWLLARRRAELGDPDGDLPASGLLWKAALELRLAQELRPRQARPCWYLYSVWWAMGKQQAARRWLRSAQDNACFTPLNPAEARELHVAGLALERRL
jgi:tetratricopeptide (TPR) repeat protein